MMSMDWKEFYIRYIFENWFKKGLETTVILTSGCCAVNAKITGTVMATSPIAESLIIAICGCWWDNSGVDELQTRNTYSADF